MWGAEGWRGEAYSQGLQSLQELRTELGYLESEKYLYVSFHSYKENQIFFCLFVFGGGGAWMPAALACSWQDKLFSEAWKIRS